jgi:hypothetical protein
MTQKWAGFYRGICTVVNPKIGPQGSELFAKFWPRPVVLKRIFHVTIVRKCSPVNYKFFKNYMLGYSTGMFLKTMKWTLFYTVMKRKSTCKIFSGFGSGCNCKMLSFNL